MSRQSDHDRALERLLRAMPGEPATTAACVDAERLAAWSEGGLALSERESIDAHLASCARCLAMLAVFAETAATHEGSASLEGSVPHEGSVPAHEVGLTPRATETPRGAQILRPRFWRSPTRWLVPITTAAAAVLIWMVLPARPPAPAFAPTSQVARDEAAPSARALQRLEGPPPEQAREAGARQAQAAPPPASVASKPAEAASEAERRRQQEGVQESVRVAEEPAAKAADTSAATQRAANEAMSDRMAAAKPPPPTAALMRAEVAMVDVRSPDPAYRWRVRGDVVERSTTGGSSWQSVTMPPGVMVTAGASPAPNVCWLIGPAGTVLRTTDGLRFDAVNIPGTGALTSIQATDASRATVTAADGQVYVTTDGGKNWTR